LPSASIATSGIDDTAALASARWKPCQLPSAVLKVQACSAARPLPATSFSPVPAVTV
jgi:hypothetical protein